MIWLVGLSAGGGSNGSGRSGGDGGTFIRGAVSVRKASNECEALTRSLKNGFSAPRNRASTVFKIEQWSNVTLGPLPRPVHGETTKAGTRTP
jgi:hypothetical protein